MALVCIVRQIGDKRTQSLSSFTENLEIQGTTKVRRRTEKRDGKKKKKKWWEWWDGEAKSKDGGKGHGRLKKTSCSVSMWDCMGKEDGALSAVLPVKCLVHLLLACRHGPFISHSASRYACRQISTVVPCEWGLFWNFTIERTGGWDIVGTWSRWTNNLSPLLMTVYHAPPCVISCHRKILK